MARRKFRGQRRHIPSSERSFQDYISTQNAPQTTKTELIRLINGGEDTFLELKLKLSNPQKIAQEIVALANTAGGTIVFGVTDQLRIEGVRNPESVQAEIVQICREKIYPAVIPFIDVIAFDNGSRIVAVDIEGKNKPYRTTDGKFYLRAGAEKREATREELSEFIEEIRPLSYENIPVRNFLEEDFDDALLWSFAEGFGKEFQKRNGYKTADFLRRDLLLAIGNAHNFLPTVAGVLLFGKNAKVADILPQASVNAIRYAGSDTGTDIVEKAEFNGNLLTLYESTLKFIKTYCDLYKHRSKKRNQTPQTPISARGKYHLYAVVEAVANILMHRDLALREIETQILIFDDAIEFINPRRTNGFAPPPSKAIRYGITQKLNPQTAAIFSRREYGAKIPQGGLPMVLKQSTLFSGKKTELYTANDTFRLRMHGG